MSYSNNEGGGGCLVIVIIVLGICLAQASCSISNYYDLKSKRLEYGYVQ